MSRKDVTIRMPEGEARAFVFTPDQGSGPWPTVLFYMDGLGVRPALFEMGERLASNGYYVLMPDMYWRIGAYEPLVPSEVLSDPERRAETLGKYLPSTNPERAMADTGVFLDWLSKQPQARAERIGVTGYCLGANIAFRAAGTYSDRVAAAGCFHGVGFATDAEDSPHRLADRITAKVLVAGGDKDAGFDDAHAERLAKVLKDAGVDFEVTIYRGSLHGYAPPDMPAYTREGSERHWREMLALFDETLKTPVAA